MTTLPLTAHEVTTLIFSLGVLVFILSNRELLRRIPRSGLLAASFGVLLVSWVATVAEGFVWGGFLNLLEHGSYAVSHLLFLSWFWTVSGRKPNA